MLRFLGMRAPAPTATQTSQCYAIVSNSSGRNSQWVEKLFAGDINDVYYDPADREAKRQFFDTQFILLDALDDTMKTTLKPYLTGKPGSVYLLEIDCSKEKFKDAALEGNLSHHLIAALNAHDWFSEKDDAERVINEHHQTGPAPGGCTIV